MQQSWVSGNGDAQLFDPQIRSPSQSESASQSPSSISHRLDELQQLPVAYPLLRVQLVNPEQPSAIGEKSKIFYQDSNRTICTWPFLNFNFETKIC